MDIFCLPFQIYSPALWALGCQPVLTALMASDWVQPTGSTSRRLAGKNGVRLGYWASQLPSCSFTVVCLPTKIRVSARHPSSDNNLYFHIPVASSLPPLLGHGAVRVALHSRVPHESSCTLPYDLSTSPTPLLNSPRVVHWNLSSLSCRNSKRHCRHAQLHALCGQSPRKVISSPSTKIRT